MYVKLIEGPTWVATIGPLEIDDVIETQDEFGQHLIDQGIAIADAGPVGLSAQRRRQRQDQAAKEELDVATRHGDSHAARRLERAQARGR